MEIFDPIALKALSILLIQITRTKSVGLEEIDLNNMNMLVQNFVAEAAAVEDAIVAVSHAYLDDQEILFSDMQEELLKLNQERQKLLSYYNSTAAIVGFAPINLRELKSVLVRRTSEIAHYLITKSRADAKRARGHLDEARRLLSSLVADQLLADKLPRRPSLNRQKGETKRLKTN